MSGGHGHADHGNNKGIALLISVLALVLAFSETLGKSAQTSALSYNIEASNLWAFFQAKTIRQTTLRTAAEQLESIMDTEKSRKQAETWKKTAARYQDEPDTGEGRNQLAARAKTAEKMGFSAYAMSRDENDPVAQAIHGLLDHTVNIDQRIEAIMKQLEKLGAKVEDERATADKFDPNYLNKIVD